MLIMYYSFVNSKVKNTYFCLNRITLILKNYKKLISVAVK